MTLVLENGPYIFNVNNAFAEGSTDNKFKRMLLELKNCLVDLGGTGVIWTVVASSDSVSVKNIGDADPDLWLDIGDIIGNPAGTQSWCILENSTTGGQLLINAYYIASNFYHYANILYSPAGLFTDDGTTTVKPTATDSTYVVPNNADFTLNSSVYLNFVLHVMTSADHKTTRFYFMERGLGLPGIGGKMGLIEEVVNTPSEWISTNKVCVLNNNITPVCNSEPYYEYPMIYNLDDMDWNVYLETATPYAGWIATRVTAECYGSIGYAGGGQGRPIIHVGGNVSKIGLFRPNAGTYGGSYGRLRDIYWGPYYNYSMTTYPDDGSGDWIQLAAFIMPWNGSKPIPVEY